jgi:hypothetical protein
LSPRTTAPAAARSLPWAAYAAIVISWLATRAYGVVSVDLTPWMLNDLDIYQGWLAPLHAGGFPVDDPAWQYPPGIAPLFLAAGSLAIDFRWAFTLVILSVDAAVMGVLLWAHARASDAGRSGAGGSLRGPWLWAVAGLLVGSIMFVRFDVVPTLFAVLAIVLAARPALSGVSSALGLTVKVWPALMLLVLPRRGLGRGVLAFAATAAVVLAAFGLVYDDSLSFVGNQQARGLQVESIGALPYELHSLFGGTVAFGLKYGSIQVLMSGTEAVGAALTIAGLVLLGLIAWWRLSGRLDAVPAGDVGLAVMLVSVATSRVYSPQFNVWLIGIGAAAMLDPATRQRVTVAVVIAISLVTQVVYPWSATQLVTGEVTGIGAQAVRVVLLVTAVVLGLRAIRRRPVARVAEGASTEPASAG